MTLSVRILRNINWVDSELPPKHAECRFEISTLGKIKGVKLMREENILFDQREKLASLDIKYALWICIKYQAMH